MSAPSNTTADGRPHATKRLAATDHGVVLAHGHSPGACDALGARDVWVFAEGDRYFMHYDGAGPRGWLCCLAESRDGVMWEKKGAVLDFGAPGTVDAASASYGSVHFDGQKWRMFYLGTPNASPAPAFVPMIPYSTLRAEAPGPTGPWTKSAGPGPFRCEPGTFYSHTASPGQIVRHGDEWLMFFSAAAQDAAGAIWRTLGLARTRDLDGAWRIDPVPVLPSAEQVENSSLHFEPESGLWFLFTNHVGYDPTWAGHDGHEYTDAVWVYWSADLTRWNPTDKAVVLDRHNCTWSRRCIGLPSVLRVGDRLALYYDAPRGHDDARHIERDIGLAWLPLPLRAP